VIATRAAVLYTAGMAKNPSNARAAAAAHAPRVRTLQQRLRRAKLPALLITNKRDIRYLTGFVGDDSWLLVRAASSQLHVLSDFRFEEQIRREAPHVKAVMRRRSLSEELAELVNGFELRRVGVQEEYVTLAQRKAMARRVGGKRLVDFSDGLLQQRAVKSEPEVAAIRKALTIQQEAYRRTLAFLKPGLREVEVAAYLEYQMRLLGADGPSFPTIVAADANASLPHAIPGQTKLRKGGIVLIDFGARWGGYCSDLTRVVGLGGMSAKMREVYQIVLEAQSAGIAAIKPGRPLKEVDAAARKVIDDAGYGPQFGHSLGHGIGLDIHEQPTLSGRSEGVLEPGQIVTVEPGIYLPGVGGVRIEDDVLVTARGGTILSSLPKDLKSAII
jgi:Xaa-Pro aminopeptidase